MQSFDPGGTFCKIFTLLYADDLVLLATSHAQATRMLQQVIAVFKAIGLQLSLRKCKYIASPCLPKRAIYASTVPIPVVPSFKFLGILIGFGVSCESVLGARLASATNAFWGYYKILKDPPLGFRRTPREASKHGLYRGPHQGAVLALHRCPAQGATYWMMCAHNVVRHKAVDKDHMSVFTSHHRLLFERDISQISGFAMLDERTA